MAVHNRSPERVHSLLADHGEKGNFLPAPSIKEFVAALERPRRALIMVPAGPATDAVIAELIDYMEPGDVVVDGGYALHATRLNKRLLSCCPRPCRGKGSRVPDEPDSKEASHRRRHGN